MKTIIKEEMSLTFPKHDEAALSIMAAYKKKPGLFVGKIGGKPAGVFKAAFKRGMLKDVLNMPKGLSNQEVEAINGYFDNIVKSSAMPSVLTLTKYLDSVLKENKDPQPIKENFELKKLMTVFSAKEVSMIKNWLNGKTDELPEKLESKLYDYFRDEMPVGAMKAREEDPYVWLQNRLEGLFEVHQPELSPMKKQITGLDREDFKVESPEQVYKLMKNVLDPSLFSDKEIKARTEVFFKQFAGKVIPKFYLKLSPKLWMLKKEDHTYQNTVELLRSAEERAHQMGKGSLWKYAYDKARRHMNVLQSISIANKVISRQKKEITEMAQGASKTEHSGSKKGNGAYYGRKKDAKKDSNKKRREQDKKEVNPIYVEQTNLKEEPSTGSETLAEEVFKRLSYGHIPSVEELGELMNGEPYSMNLKGADLLAWNYSMLTGGYDDSQYINTPERMFEVLECLMETKGPETLNHFKLTPIVEDILNNWGEHYPDLDIVEQAQDLASGMLYSLGVEWI